MAARQGTATEHLTLLDDDHDLLAAAPDRTVLLITHRTDVLDEVVRLEPRTRLASPLERRLELATGGESPLLG